jgi:sterol desaturase/sphingolipid hydroxylase (fatty acid hydroxylase superfamily)
VGQDFNLHSPHDLRQSVAALGLLRHLAQPAALPRPLHWDEHVSVTFTAAAHPGAEAERGVSVAARLVQVVRALYLPVFAVAVATGLVVWVAIVNLERHDQLGAALSFGRAELAAPGLVLVIVLAVVCERVWPAQRRPMLARGQVQDACFLVLYATTVVPLMTLMSVGFATVLGTHLKWIEAPGTAHWPIWALVVPTLVAMDGANWLAHYADHRIEPLWRLHAVHHSQEELSVLTSFRAHPLVHTTGFLLATVPVVVLMGDRSIAPVLITTYVCLGTLTHTNVNWSFGPLGWLMVSPAYHRIHHSVDGPEGKNLGIVLTVWDVMARRAQFPVQGASVCRTGLAGRPLAIEQATPRARLLSLLAGQLLEPFTARRPMTRLGEDFGCS